MSKVLDRLRDLLRAEDDIVADELRSEATARGCTAVAEAVDRQVVTVAGTIVEVCAENAELVEHDATLFRVRQDV